MAHIEFTLANCCASRHVAFGVVMYVQKLAIRSAVLFHSMNYQDKAVATCILAISYLYGPKLYS